MASPCPEEATLVHKRSYRKVSKGDFFPGVSFKSWSAYKSALLQTCFRFKDHLMSCSDDANELGEVRQQSMNDMRRCLSQWDLTWFGFGAVIGAGIFVLTGQEAHSHVGLGIVLSYVLSGLLVMLSVFSYTEFAVEIPVAGGSFAYLRVQLGYFAAFIAAGNILLEGIVGSATVARCWTSYFTMLVNRQPNCLSLGMIQPHTKIDPNAASSLAFQSVGMKWENSLVALGALKGMATVLLVGALGQAWYTTQIARAHMIPPWFAHVHPKTSTAINATLKHHS